MSFRYLKYPLIKIFRTHIPYDISRHLMLNSCKDRVSGKEGLYLEQPRGQPFECRFSV